MATESNLLMAGDQSSSMLGVGHIARSVLHQPKIQLKNRGQNALVLLCKRRLLPNLRVIDGA